MRFEAADPLAFVTMHSLSTCDALARIAGKITLKKEPLSVCFMPSRPAPRPFTLPALPATTALQARGVLLGSAGDVELENDTADETCRARHISPSPLVTAAAPQIKLVARDW